MSEKYRRIDQETFRKGVGADRPRGGYDPENPQMTPEPNWAWGQVTYERFHGSIDAIVIFSHNHEETRNDIHKWYIHNGYGEERPITPLQIQRAKKFADEQQEKKGSNFYTRVIVFDQRPAEHHNEYLTYQEMINE